MAPEIRGHEPRLAFDGGPFGIRILARLIDAAPALLREGGVLAFEVGLGQGPGFAGGSSGTAAMRASGKSPTRRARFERSSPPA